MYKNLNARTSLTLNSNADINQLMENVRSIGGNTSYAPSTTVQDLYDSNAYILSGKSLGYKNIIAHAKISNSGANQYRSVYTIESLDIDSDLTIENTSFELNYNFVEYNNDISIGTSVQLNTQYMTSIFSIGETVRVRSSQGEEDVVVTSVNTASSYIVVDEITIDHDTNYRMVGKVGVGYVDELPFNNITYSYFYKPFYVWVITNDNGTLQNIISSESTTSVTLPSGYTKKRLISFNAVACSGASVEMAEKHQFDEYLFAQSDSQLQIKTLTIADSSFYTIDMSESNTSIYGAVAPDNAILDEIAFRVTIDSFSVRNTAEDQAYHTEIYGFDENGNTYLSCVKKISKAGSHPNTNDYPPCLYWNGKVKTNNNQIGWKSVIDAGGFSFPISGASLRLKYHKLKL